MFDRSVKFQKFLKLEIFIMILFILEYPPYQMMLLDNQFLQVAIEIVKGDNEIYVRASALSFISTAVRINTLWDKLLCQLQLPVKFSIFIP